MSALLAASALLLAAPPDEPHEPAAPPAADLPVVELTAFKDGHALVRREGTLPLTGLGDGGGEAHVDGLPEPLFGTFWPYAAGEGVRLAGATAGYRTVTLTRTPLTPAEILTAAAGSRVIVHETLGERDVSYEATVLGRPVRTAAERRRNDAGPDGGQPPLPQAGEAILLRTDAGVRVVPLGRIGEFTLLGEPPAGMEDTVVRTGLTLRVEGAAGDSVRAGLSYVQPGFKWVPQYRVVLGDEGHAEVELQAVLVNDLIDLRDATVRLVVGVPSFAFRGRTDPISLQVTYENVGRALGRAGGRGPAAGGELSFLSNSVQTQVMSRSRREAEAAPEPVAVEGGARAEDLYVHTLRHVTLRRGERMTVRVRSFELPYGDRYAATFPVTPPREFLQNANDEVRRQLADLLTEANVSHSVLLTNRNEGEGGDAPLTTAPALLYRAGGEEGEDGGSGDTLLAQGLMTYAAPGAESELDLGAAVEVRADLTEEITGRRPEPKLRGDDRFERVTLRGEIAVTNRRPEATTVEVTKYVPGVVDAASGEGAGRELGPAELAAAGPGAAALTRYGVPSWWASLNPTSEIVWSVTVPPGETRTVSYEWHYFWRY